MSSTAGARGTCLRLGACAMLLAAQACASHATAVRAASACADDPPEGATAHPNVAAARELDQQGVSSFRDGRYYDAVRYFRAAYRLGGPSSELWNVARSYEKADDVEDADRAIAEYLGRHDLSPPDRADAEREARALRAHPSLLTVATTPAGALATIDGRPAPGPTPFSLEVAAGTHTLAVKHDAHASVTRTFEARLGRAVIVTLDLAGGGK